MNNFKEFDNIHTPEEWIQETLDSSLIKKKKSYYFQIVLACIVMFLCLSSFGIIYAYNKDFRAWLKGEVPNVNENAVEEIIKENKINWMIENQFLYYYEDDDEMDIQEIQVFKNGKFVKVNIQHIEEKYNNQLLSFDYAISNHYIKTFNHQGMINYSLSEIHNQTMYFCSKDNNIYSYNMKTRKIEQLTNDYDSMNPHISPKGTYIVIRKGKEQSTVYNTQTKTEKVVNDLSWSAHYGSEYIFIDDTHLLTYDNTESQNSCIINLKTLKTHYLDGQGWYPQASLLEIKSQSQDSKSTVIKHLLSHKKRTISFDIINDSLTTYVINNRYVIFEIKEKNQRIQYIYDFDLDKYRNINLSHLDSIDCFMIDNENMIFYDENNYIILSIKDIFDKD